MIKENEGKENTAPKESKFWRFLYALMPKEPMGREAWAYLDSHPAVRDRLSPEERMASVRAEMRYNGVLRGYF